MRQSGGFITPFFPDLIDDLHPSPIPSTSVATKKVEDSEGTIYMCIVSHCRHNYEFLNSCLSSADLSPSPYLPAPSPHPPLSLPSPPTLQSPLFPRVVSKSKVKVLAVRKRKLEREAIARNKQTKRQAVVDLDKMATPPPDPANLPWVMDMNVEDEKVQFIFTAFTLGLVI